MTLSPKKTGVTTPVEVASDDDEENGNGDTNPAS